MERVKIDDVLKYEQPTKYIVETENYHDDFEIPVLTAGKSFVLGYTNEVSGIFNQIPVIIFDDFTTAFHYVDFPFKVKSSAMKILKIVEEKADLKYLYYKMQTISVDKDLHKRYWISKYSQLEISLPPLSTQKNIAAKLDKAQEIISYNKQLLEKYDKLTQSLFIDMFGDPVRNEKGWEKVKLGNVSKVRIGPFGSLLHQEDYIEGGVPLVNPSHIKNGKILIDKKLTISSDKIKELESYRLKEGDVILARRGEMGRCAIVNKIEDGYLCGTGSIFIRPNDENLDELYLYKVLSSNSFKNILENSAKGITMKNLNSKIVFDLDIPLPSMKLQDRFALSIEKIEIQKQWAQETLVKSEELFQSLLKESFK